MVTYVKLLVCMLGVCWVIVCWGYCSGCLREYFASGILIFGSVRLFSSCRYTSSRVAWMMQNIFINRSGMLMTSSFFFWWFGAMLKYIQIQFMIKDSIISLIWHFLSFIWMYFLKFLGHFCSFYVIFVVFMQFCNFVSWLVIFCIVTPKIY